MEFLAFLEGKNSSFPKEFSQPVESFVETVEKSKCGGALPFLTPDIDGDFPGISDFSKPNKKANKGTFSFSPNKSGKNRKREFLEE